MPISAMRTSAPGINFIKKWERCRLRAYDDGYGFLTIGWGHRIYPGDKRVITQAEADDMLRLDLTVAEGALRLNKEVKLYQHEFNALVSLIHNIGGGNWSGSTLRKLLREGKYDAAAAEFPKWRKSAGQVSNGLIRRREEERQIFLNATYVIK